MVVAKDTPAYDGEIGIAADEIVRELPLEINKPCERRPIDCHVSVAAAHDDAVLIIIDIRRILEAPLLAAECHGDNTEVLPRRMVESSGIALVLHTERTGWVSAPVAILPAAAMVNGSFSGFARFTVISNSPYSVPVVHLRSFSFYPGGCNWNQGKAYKTNRWPFREKRHTSPGKYAPPRGAKA